MAIRGSLKGHQTDVNVNKEALQKIIDSAVEKELRKWVTAGKKAMEEIRKKAVNSWFRSSGSGRAMAFNDGLIISDHAEIKQTDNMATISISSYLNPAIIEASFEMNSMAYDSMRNWRNKHEKDGWSYGKVVNGSAIDMPMSIGEYMIDLTWKRGFRALPDRETHTGTGWVNPKSSKNDSNLENYIKKQLKSKWVSTVKSFKDNPSKKVNVGGR